MSSPVANPENILIPLGEIMSATEEFHQKNEIAWGEYSKLYKGQLSESWGNRTTAFKRFTRNRRDRKKVFRNELEVISNLNHENIIPFLGYCDEGEEMIMVYDYPVTDSLAAYINDSAKRRCLTWQHRLVICMDAARVLNYLHSGLGQHDTVIHGSFMDDNILLDDNLKAKICGFEFSELIPGNQPCKQVYKPYTKGTYSDHKDPIYLQTGFLNVELDIYSFGVLLFNILTSPKTYGERNVFKCIPNSLTMKVQHHYHNRLDSLIDPAISDQIGGPSFRMIEEITCKCLSYNIKDRPTMDTVVKTIEDALDIYNREAISVKGSRGEHQNPREFLVPFKEIKLAMGMFKKSSLPHCINSDLFTAELTERWPNRTVVFKIYKIPGRYESCIYMQKREMFNNELEIVSRFHHENIIPYIGYCDEGDNMILIYEHAVNGSLHDHLQDQDKLRCIPWEQRLKICLGAARGLKCLHSGLRDENRLAVHRHVRSEYILLDENMNAKISGFGLSMLVPSNKPQVSDNGWELADSTFDDFKASMDPIYKESYIVNTEVDVYSFGVKQRATDSTTTIRSLQFQKLEDLRIPLKEINLATSEFSENSKIGKGGFGVVYKGRLSESWTKHEAAFKCLKKTSDKDKTGFLKELKLISMFQHQNIIHLIGYCDDGDEMILVSEYCINGSLDDHLEDPKKRRLLTWVKRLKICLGAAKGLDYLHTGLGEDNRVVHRDVKSGNILLDDNWEAKICDFGLSKSGLTYDHQHSKYYTGVAGTDYYMDPIYHESGILRTESDVYSFGVVMFEMLRGMPAWHVKSFGRDKPQPLINLVRRYYDYGKDLLIDPEIKAQIDKDSFHTFIEIAYQCISFNSKERPTMEKVADKIEEALDFQVKKDVSSKGD
ncbi:serine/threonine-protein kinase, active site protein [Artemisia annua]|uniref:Serine/threonine-protein kinase, active site protein n=1 Tax=Artemisia annua TaxID=35608 RepID=A0A2U1P1Q7_ARTAN|nr:serine/threonine-protein kinase, active site protein [Artemisia annua]